MAQSCPTLCDPVPGIPQARILEWAAFPFSRGSSQPRNQTQVSHIAGRFFTSWATREAPQKQNLLLLPWYLNRYIHTHTLLHSFKYCVGQKVHWVFHKTIWRHLNEFLTNPIFKPLRSIEVFTAILRVAYPGTELLYFMEVNRGSSRYPQRATGKYFSFVAGQSLSQLFNATTDAGMQPQTIQRCGSEYDHV